MSRRTTDPTQQQQPPSAAGVSSSSATSSSSAAWLEDRGDAQRGVCDCVGVGVGQSLSDDGVSAGRVMEMTRSAGVRGSVASPPSSSSAAWLPAGLASPALRTLSSIAR